MEEETGNTAADQMIMVRGNSWSEKNATFHLLPRSCRPEPASSTRFKGVVLQQNGNWGAHIYADHQRIWLGTFKSESSAAVAYDRAATKLRNSDDPDRNFSGLSPYEIMFQEIQTTDAVLCMIRDGSYESKLAQFLSATGDSLLEGAGHLLIAENDGGAGAHELFQKELTPSDVGKLNRLVIPKKHALKYFPRIETDNKERAGGRRAGLIEDVGTTEGIMLEFRDLQDRPWEFRYCYWKSSQSFVFTKGWNKFVKRKKLRAKDVVTFYRCQNREGSTKGAFFFLIGVGHGGARRDEGDTVGCGVGGGAREVSDWGLNPGIRAGKLFEFGSRIAVPPSRAPEAEQTEEGEETLEPATTTASGLEEKRGVRLFGVLIGER